MRCHDCEFFIHGCMRMCDTRCLDHGNKVDLLQIKTILESEGNHDKNIRELNKFVTRNASSLISTFMESDSENDKVVCVAWFAKVLRKAHVDKILNMPYESLARHLFLMITKHDEVVNMEELIRGMKIEGTGDRN